MKLIFALIFFIPTLAASLELSDPVLDAERILEIANTYLVTERNIEIERYTIEGVSFDFLDNRWHVFYNGKPNKDGSVGLGNHFGIILSNTEKPIIEMVPGL